MKKNWALIFVIGFWGMSFLSKNTIDFIYPTYFPKPEYDFKKNPLHISTVELGRKLFFDPKLSLDNTISCASCHSPYNAFAHTDHDLSHGIADQIGNRNAPALFNLAWQKSFMWDGAINHLDMQALAPISHKKEMGESIQNVVAKLQGDRNYPFLFYSAYRDSLITGEKLLKALSQFQLTLISANAKYDRVKRGEGQFSDQEKKGYAMFRTHCNSCHSEPLFSNYDFANNGLSLDSSLLDFGRAQITKQKKDSLLFKIPSLRNLSFSYPYMHDGRFKKINEVLNHYTNGIEDKKNVSKPLQSPIRMSSNEKSDLTAFLLTLNDTGFVFNPKHQFPKEILSQAKD